MPDTTRSDGASARGEEPRVPMAAAARADGMAQTLTARALHEHESLHAVAQGVGTLASTRGGSR